MNEEQWRWTGGDGDGDSGGFVAYPNDHRTSQQRRHKYVSSWPVILYVPNLLGYIRIMLAFRGLHHALHSRQSKALNTWIAASLIDMVDGIAARWLNQCSEFGILLDIVADNILRTIIWSSCIMEVSNNDAAILDGSSFYCVYAAAAIICLEWTTMLCSQSSAAARTKQKTEDDYSHWKDSKQKKIDIDKKTELSPPFWVQAVFENNFRTLPGIFAIYGLFVAPLSTYVCYADSIKQTWPSQLFSEHILSFFIYMSYAGRFLSAMVELWLCYEYLSGVIERDSERNAMNHNRSF